MSIKKRVVLFHPKISYFNSDFGHCLTRQDDVSKKCELFSGETWELILTELWEIGRFCVENEVSSVGF